MGNRFPYCIVLNLDKQGLQLQVHTGLRPGTRIKTKKDLFLPDSIDVQICKFWGAIVPSNLQISTFTWFPPSPALISRFAAQ